MAEPVDTSGLINPHGLALSALGRGLMRPESVLCMASGDLFVSHTGHGVMRIAPDGAMSVAGRASPDMTGFTPNGIAMTRDGSFLVANLGPDGGVWRIGPTGELSRVTETLNGRRWPGVNFIFVDDQDRIWITVSSSLEPRHLAYRDDIRDGYIMRLDGDRWTEVASGVHYTNEARLHPDGEWLYVSETFARRITRQRLDSAGKPQDRETVAEIPNGAYVDGIAFDAEGGLWAACVVENQLLRIDPCGRVEVVLAEPTPDWTAEVARAFARHEMQRSHLDTTPARRLRNISSIAFGGEGLRRGYIGCLLADHILAFDAPAAGAPLPHWEWAPDLSPFEPFIPA